MCMASAAGHGTFIVTGNVGKIMQESSQIAYTVAKQVLSDWPPALAPESYDNFLNPTVQADTPIHNQEWRSFLENHDVHVHIPSGAMPKDGSSGGITLATSLVSLSTGLKVNPSIAMTGELTVTGRVLPIGGVKQKILAAKQIPGISHLIFSRHNQGQIEQLEEFVTEGLEFKFVDRIEEVLAYAVPGLSSH